MPQNQLIIFLSYRRAKSARFHPSGIALLSKVVTLFITAMERFSCIQICGLSLENKHTKILRLKPASSQIPRRFFLRSKRQRLYTMSYEGLLGGMDHNDWMDPDYFLSETGDYR